MKGEIKISIEDYELLKRKAYDNENSMALYNKEILDNIENKIKDYVIEKVRVGYNDYMYYISETSCEFFSRMSIVRFIKWKRTNK